MKISVQELGFAYDGQQVLDDISLEVGEGEILALVGPNGSGKTTLLRNLSGVLRPKAGAVYLDFKELGRFSPRELARHLAAVEQERRVGFDFTVRELVELGRLPYLGRLERLGPRDHEAVRRAMKLTHVEEFAERPISKLSGGERQRVFLAIALAQEPQILLLDEPTAHLDVKYQLELMQIIEGQARAGLMVVMALHDLNLAAAFAHRIVLMAGGRVVASGTPGEVLTPKRLRAVFGVEAVVRENPITGGVYVHFLPSRSTPTDKKGRVLVIGGGGAAAEILPHLAAKYQVSVGVVSPLDSDYQAARQLGLEVIDEAPFAPVSEEARRRLCQKLSQADAVVVCPTWFSPGNLKVLEVLDEKVKAKTKIFILDPKTLQEHDFTGGKASQVVERLLAAGAVKVEAGRLAQLDLLQEGPKDGGQPPS